MRTIALSKWTFVVVAVLAIAAGAFSNRLIARAQAAEPASFVVQAGDQGGQNVDVLAFAPASLQVHRGDKVTWVINSLHDIHFEKAPSPLVVAPTVDGKPLPQINPAVAFRTLDNGAAYKGGEANSGLPLKPEDTVYSLIIDAEPGTYSYFCDVHPGMVGLINVVADGTAIPTAADATLQGSMELRSTIAAANEAGLKLEAQTAQAGQVQVGSGDTGRATINQYFPLVTQIKAGESVTFTIPKTSVEPHTISWPPVRGQDVVPKPVEGGPPMLLVGQTLAPMTQSGATVGAGEAFSSGLLEPGAAFTLTFSAPGVYEFTCNIHPGMNGTIIVSA